MLEEPVVRLLGSGRLAVAGHVHAAQLHGGQAAGECLADDAPAHEMHGAREASPQRRAVGGIGRREHPGLDVEQEPAEQLALVLGHEQPGVPGRQQPPPGSQVAELRAHGDAQVVGPLHEQLPELGQALSRPVVAHRDTRLLRSADALARGLGECGQEGLLGGTCGERETHDVDRGLDLASLSEAETVHRGVVGRVGVQLGVHEQVAHPFPAQMLGQRRTACREAYRAISSVDRSAAHRSARARQSRRAAQDDQRRPAVVEFDETRLAAL